MKGSVRKRGKRYYIAFTIEENGKRRRIERVCEATNKKEAEKELRQAISKYEADSAAFERNKHTVASIAENWLKDYVNLNCGYHTRLNYKSCLLRHILEDLGPVRVQDLTTGLIQDFINRKAREYYSRPHISTMLIVIKGILNYAANYYNLPVKALAVKIPKMIKPSIQRQVISRDDFESMTEIFKGSCYYTLLMLAYYTGGRMSELLALTWSDVNFNDQYISISKNLYYRYGLGFCFGKTKNRSSVRKVYMPEVLINCLQEEKLKQSIAATEKRYKHFTLTEKEIGVEKVLFIAKSPDEDLGFLCRRNNGSYLKPNDVQYFMSHKLRNLGFSFTFHDFRHTHATLLLQNSGNIKEISRRLGHAKIDTTMNIYIHSTEEGQKELATLATGEK